MHYGIEVGPPGQREEGEVQEQRAAATLGGGCFWCLEAVYQELEGVFEVTSGYAGGHVANPTYEAVCGGATGHAEVVQVTFDPSVLPFDEVLRVFFAIHDPTTRDRQGADVGTQYRSIILTHDDAQAAIARRVMQEVAAEGVYPDPLVTEVTPLEAFFPAGQSHRDYYRTHESQPYCQVVIAPKLRTLGLEE